MKKVLIIQGHLCVTTQIKTNQALRRRLHMNMHGAMGYKLQRSNVP